MYSRGHLFSGLRLPWRVNPAGTPLRVVLAAVLLFCLPACSHYNLGPTAKLPYKTMYVATVKNLSQAPQVQAPVTEFLRTALLQEGNIQLVDQKDADVTLELTLTDYKRSIAATSQTNTINAQSYTLSLMASCTLVDNRDGKVYFQNRMISVTQEAFIQNNTSFNDSEYQAMTMLARTLGEKVKNYVVTSW